MKEKHRSALPVLAIILSLFVATAGTPVKQFRDGVYKGESRSKYTHEPFWGQVQLKIKDDKVVWLKFKIIDKERHEVFGPKYERHYKYTPFYIMQCRNELKGIKIYTEVFAESKNIEKVDAITGATWSHNLLKSTFYVTLEKARNK
jgi:major membrane immunogen (membrane-anchored lipoprotein)